MSFLEHVGLATISGVILGVVLVLARIIYDEISLKIRVAKEAKNFYHMQNPCNPDNKVWINKEYAQDFIDHGWKIVK